MFVYTNESDFVLIVEKDADEIIAHNIEKKTEQLTTETRDKLKRTEAEKQMKKRKIIVGFHHGKLNPLPSNWNFPKSLTVIALINMWHRGSTRDNIPAFKYLSVYNVAHIKQEKHTFAINA